MTTDAAIPSLVADDTDVDAGFWLAAASAAIRRWCGWHIGPNIEQTVTLDTDGGDAVGLPSMHVTGLTSLTVDGTDMTDLAEWSERGLLRLRSGMFPDGLRRVTVTFRHGYAPDEIPDVQAICLNMARRAMSGPGIIGSQSVNGASVTYLTAGGAPLSIPMLDIERQQLAPYRIGGGITS